MHISSTDFKRNFIILAEGFAFRMKSCWRQIKSLVGLARLWKLFQSMYNKLVWRSSHWMLVTFWISRHPYALFCGYVMQYYQTLQAKAKMQQSQSRLWRLCWQEGWSSVRVVEFMIAPSVYPSCWPIHCQICLEKNVLINLTNGFLIGRPGDARKSRCSV